MVSEGKLNAAAGIIIKFCLHDDFDIKSIVESLIEDPAGANKAKGLITDKKDLYVWFINLLSEKNNSRLAVKCIKEFGLDPNSFPNLVL